MIKIKTYFRNFKKLNLIFSKSENQIKKELKR